MTGEERILHLEGDSAHPANGGLLCAKAKRLRDGCALDGRLLYPLVEGRRQGWERTIALLARRLAAEDGQTDLMNLDPVFVPEFANAGWLLELPGDTVTDDTLEGIAETVRWEDEIFAAPLWANTQVLWYRKSLAREAGLDMSQPVT
ncbi:extracellular solute-binding protein, partial [uncultured Sphingobium sp.]|uniref:extracellular solute-binding protein n=1 Tax=uncultured Sphingobium sp. TaxID=316087 RepID=UPI00260E14D8